MWPRAEANFACSPDFPSLLPFPLSCLSLSAAFPSLLLSLSPAFSSLDALGTLPFIDHPGSGGGGRGSCRKTIPYSTDPLSLTAGVRLGGFLANTDTDTYVCKRMCVHMLSCACTHTHTHTHTRTHIGLGAGRMPLVLFICFSSVCRESAGSVSWDGVLFDGGNHQAALHSWL